MISLRRIHFDNFFNVWKNVFHLPVKHAAITCRFLIQAT